MKSILGQLQRHLKGYLLIILLVIFSSTLLLATPAQAAIVILSSPSPLPSGQVGVSYSANLYVIGNTGPCTWSVSGLPPGLIFTPAAAPATTGIISGTPTTAGAYTLVVIVTDSIGPSAPQVFPITVAEKPITFTTTLLPEAKEAVSYQVKIEVTGGKTPYTFSLTSGVLPSGLTLDSINGIISGTPAKGSAGSYTITIGVSDSSTPKLSAQQSYSLVVEKGFYESVIRISSTLAAGETKVYVDGTEVAILEGGETTRQTFAVGTTPVITVDPLISHPTKADVRFRADEEEIEVSEASPDATFDYTPEYYLDLKTDPSQIATLTGSDWYEEGSTLRATAQAQIEGEAGTQYRFSHWLLPTGEKVEDVDLSWLVSASGKVTATYDTYYLLTVTSPQGEVDGGGWCKAETIAEWSVNPPEVPMSGILGFFRGKLKPENASGDEFMDAPKTIDIAWNPDYTMPAILISLLILFLAGVGFGIYRLVRPPQPKPVAAPATPTIVLIEGGGKGGLEGTREQLVEQFRQLLQKYEGEVKSTVKGEELPEAKLLAEGKEEARCGHTSKKLLRTVVGNWHKIEEKIVPPGKKAATTDVSIRTTWARDIYEEWEVSTCSLPEGHSGNITVP